MLESLSLQATRASIQDLFCPMPFKLELGQGEQLSTSQKDHGRKLSGIGLSMVTNTATDPCHATMSGNDAVPGT